MNKFLSTTLIVLGILALAGIVFFAGSMYTRASSFGPYMMRGNGWNNDSYSPGPNMMQGRGQPGMGPGMMQGWNNGINPSVTPLTVDQAKAAAESYLANLENSDLQIAEIMIFDNNGYVVVTEASTGIGAFELLVDPVSQIAYPEHGPNMMWNLKYGSLNHSQMINGNGMMGGGMMMGRGMMPGGYGNMMGGWQSTAPFDISAEMTVTPEQAVEYAQKYLDANFAGASTEHPAQFYGYYTIDFSKDGSIAGMLSVNGYSGQIFLHVWHGTFIEEIEFE